jgi:Rrf2 family protein
MVSVRAHYACLAMMELALLHEQERPVVLREITQRHGIPQPFLVQIFQQLRIAGLVTSTRGSQGGYRLAVSPEEITLQEVVDAISGETTVTIPKASDQSSEKTIGRELMEVWQEAAAAHRDVLDRIRLGDLSRQCDSTRSLMFYI